MFSLREERNTDGVVTEILSVMKDVGVILYSEKGNVGNRAKDDVRQYNIARKNDIVLNSMNVIIGSVGVSRYDGCISPAYYAISPKDSTSSDFWGYWFWRPETQGLIASRACGLMEIRRKISTENLLDLDVYSPLKREQQEVGTLLSDLDALIAGREQGLAKLRNLKKAMLEKMLPRAGAKVPEVRFKGFEGEWEERRLGDLLKIGNGKDYKHLSPGAVPVYGTGGYMTSVAEKIADGPSVCIGRKGTIDEPQYLEGPFWTVDTLFYTYGYKDVEQYYVYCMFQTIQWRLYNEASGVPSLSKFNISEISVAVPSMDEQQKIGAYFRSLDALIAARREEVGKLKDLKKALLDRMFV